MNTSNQLLENEVMFSRVLNAPRKKAFDLYTDPKHLDQWWGPAGWTNTIDEMDVRTGGKARLTMHGPDGMDFPNLIEYHEVVPGTKLHYYHGSGKADDPTAFDVTVDFEDVGTASKINIKVGFTSVEMKKDMIEKFGIIDGNKQMLDRFENTLKSLSDTKELVITRELKAPMALVYEVWTTPEHMAKWWGPAGFEINVKSMDFVPGGVLHYCISNAGMEMWGRFEYLEMNPVYRMAFINTFSDANGGIARAPFSPHWPLETLNLLTLQEQDGITTLTLRGGPINASTEENAIFEASHSNMQQGFAGTFEQLTNYLAKLQA